MEVHEKYMQRCLELAARGLGRTAPNPLVGSVVVIDDKIVGEGFHEYFGGHHAEVNAINSALQSVTEDRLKSATLYVNLEPCSHFGKTPPCTDAILRHGIPRVVIGSLDPFEDAAGRGVKQLQAAGIDVAAGVCKTESDALNKRFFTFHLKKRPYIILKFAQSQDGFIAPADPERSRLISNDWSRKIVHKWRTEEPGIMVGSATVLQDNPHLTAREWPGKQPVRIVIDRRGIIPDKNHVMDNRHKTIVFTCVEKPNQEHIEFVRLEDTEYFLEHVMAALHSRTVQSVLVEGGTRLITALTARGLWDEARIFTAPFDLQNGVLAPMVLGKTVHEELIAGDRLTYLIPAQ